MITMLMRQLELLLKNWQGIRLYSEYEKFKVIQDRTFVSDFDKFSVDALCDSDE